MNAKYPKTRLNIRWMIRRDIPEVLAIEASGFEFHWCEDDFVRCLRQRNCIGMVAEQDDRVAGFMVYELHNNRIHVLNFAVAEDYRRRGVGSQMVAKLVAKLSPERRNHITTILCMDNQAAMEFFRANGFKATNIERGYYKEFKRDAIRLCRWPSNYLKTERENVRP
jgi:ribosomal-protein-alanine N-acetyltransferase